MSLIYMCGDPHGRFDHIVEAVHEAHESGECPDAVILLGDMECDRPLDIELDDISGLTQIWFIHGNHDTDVNASWACLNTGGLAKRNLHGRVVEIGGVSVAGLGGVFRSSIWAPPQAPTFHSYEEWRKSFIKKIPSRLFGEREFREERRHLSSVFPSDITRLTKMRAPGVRQLRLQPIDFIGSHFKKCPYNSVSC